MAIQTRRAQWAIAVMIPFVLALGMSGGARGVVTESITYQGQLADANGDPVNDTVPMRFRVYDAPSGGSLLFDTDNMSVAVSGGLFNVSLPIPQQLFDGQSLWLLIDVAGQSLSPRQELSPAPYAMSLRPGASVIGPPPTSHGTTLFVQMPGGYPNGKALSGFALATGTAVRARAGGGRGLWATSDNEYAVRGSSGQSWGGYFTSDEGYGIVVSTGGADHWDHAGTFEAIDGYGILAKSEDNMAIRGEAGETGETSPGAGDALWQPVGNVGLVGLGASRGVYGSSRSSYGVYATSLNWYGVYGRTSRGDNNYGLYTPDNFSSNNINMAGAIMNVVQNGGETALEPGDVVVFAGLGEPRGHQGTRHVQVARADVMPRGAIGGVVKSHYNSEIIELEEDDPDALAEAGGIWISRDEPIAPGEFLLVVTHGPAEVRASAVGARSIQASDLLVADWNSAHAVPAADGSIPTARVVGTALTPLDEGGDFVWAFVRPH